MRPTTRKLSITSLGLALLAALAAPVIGAPAPPAKPPAKTPAPVKPAPVKPTPVPTPVPGPAVYEAQCSFCHAPKAVRSLPDTGAWVKLLYTSGCPQVTIKLDESQRRAIRAFIEAEFKKPVTPPASAQSPL